MKIRIACVQLNPRIGYRKENTDRALEILAKAFPQGSKFADLVILPELAFTGYNFPSQEAISPYLEHARVGYSSKILSQISEMYNCYTVIGYPEVDDGKIFNSLIVSSPVGKFIHNYRKAFLFETDEKWGCKMGDDFKSFLMKFQDKDIRTSIGICMDLNPYRFEAPFYAYEFANHCLQVKAKLIICPMLWLQKDSPSIKKEQDPEVKQKQIDEIARNFESVGNSLQINIDQPKDEALVDPSKVESDQLDLHKPDVANINYWILRFLPFLNYSTFRQSKLKPVVAICNRVGLESDVFYAGSSGIFQFNHKQSNTQYHDSRNDSVDYLGCLGQGVEGIIVRDVEIED